MSNTTVTTIKAEVVMLDFEFIHSREDVPYALEYASKLGFVIKRDAPTDEPKPNIVTPSEINRLASGSFMLYKPEWVFDAPKFTQIESGYNKGKYFQNPATNFAAVNLYFGGERKTGSILKLGGGHLSRDRNWYRPSDHTLQPVPLEIKLAFDQIRKHIDFRKRLRGGGHDYSVLRGAWKKLTEGLAMPPFDYIEWPPSHGTQ